MKLIIKRDQKVETGAFGRHKGMIFVLSYRIELTPEEQALVAKYRVEDYPLVCITRQNLHESIKEVLMKGITRTRELNYVGILLSEEETIKAVCKDFKTLLEVIASFGGEEVLEF